MEAVAYLRRGLVVAFPTDTVYGVGAHSGLPGGIRRLYEVKRRSRSKAIPLLIADADELEDVALDVPSLARELAGEFWPGGLTLILAKSPSVSDELTGGGGTVGVRVPDHEVTLTLIRRLGAPLAATSANLSGQAEAVTAEEVRMFLAEGLALVLDGGSCPGGVPSTVVDLTVAPAQIRRRGARVREIESYLRKALG